MKDSDVRSLRASWILIATAALVCAAVPPAAAQRTSTLSGVVTRSDDGQPLAGVLVVVAGTALRTSTDVKGRFLLERITAGRLTVQFRQIGSAPSDVVVDVPPDSAASLAVILVPRPIELGTLIVEGASRAPELLLEAPAAVSVIDPGAKRAGSLAGQPPVALATVPGLDVVQSGVNDFNVNARGFNSTLARSVLVLQDGRDLSVPFLGSQEWAALSQPIDEIERIEVVRGPGSALYGANAFGGLITLTTPAARDAPGTRISVGGGELTTWRADARHAAVFGAGRFGYRVNLGYTRSDSWTRSRTRLDGQDFAVEYLPATDSAVNPPLPGFELTPLNGQARDPATGRAVGEPKPLQNAYGSGRFDYYADNGAMLTAEGGAAQTQNEVFVTGIGRVQVIEALRPWARIEWATDALKLTGWYTGRTAQDPQILLSSGRPIRDQSAVLQVDGQYRRRFAGERGRFVLGAAARNARVDTKTTLMGSQDDDRSDAYYSAYAQLEYAVFPRVRIIGATRYDRSDLFDAELSPKAAIVFSPTPRQAVRLSVNRAFLTPSQIEFFLNIQPAVQNLLPLETALRASPLGPALDSVPNGQLFDSSAGVPVLARGNPDLVPERVTSWEVGYKGQLGDRLFITVDAYIARVNDFVTSLLPATLVNPAFQSWTSPGAVPAQFHAPLENAVHQALAGTTAEFGLTRLPNGRTAIVVSYGNAGVADVRGLELGASVELTNAVRLGGSYTMLDVDIKQQQQGDVLLPNTPKHKGTISISYSGRKGLDIGVDARIVAGYSWAIGVWRGYIPASQTVNLTAGYRVSPLLRVHALATNVFDEQRFQLYGGSVIGRRVLAGVTATF